MSYVDLAFVKQGKVKVLSHWTGREVLRLLLLRKHNSGQGSRVASRFLGWAQARVCKIERVHPPTGDPLSPFSEAFS